MPWSRAFKRCVENHGIPIEAAGDGVTAVAELYSVDLMCRHVQRDVTQGDTLCAEIRTRADRDRVGLGIGPQNVERLRRPADLDAAARTGSRWVSAAVAAKDVAAAVDEITGPIPEAAMTLEKPLAAGAG